jgi:hypothetical protein
MSVCMCCLLPACGEFEQRHAWMQELSPVESSTVNSYFLPLFSADRRYASLPVWLFVCQPALLAAGKRGNHHADWHAVWVLLMSLDIYACWLLSCMHALRPGLLAFSAEV